MADSRRNASPNHRVDSRRNASPNHLIMVTTGANQHTTPSILYTYYAMIILYSMNII